MTGYPWNDQKILLDSLTKACQLVNDKVKTRLPINGNLLKQLLFELQRKYAQQPYLENMYKAVFVLAYYRLMHIGELVKSVGQHASESERRAYWQK